MNHDASQQGFELPTPLPTQESSKGAFVEQVAAHPEQAPLPPITLPQDQPVVPLVTQQVQQAASVSQLAPAQATLSQSPVAAEDNDLIEKEWVDKAKQIVAATREDPYTQNKELGRFKADYLKKRYNKDMKLEES